MTLDKERRYVFVWACLIFLAGFRFGRSASRRKKMGMPQSSCPRRSIDDGHYFAYPALHSNGHSKKMQFWGSTPCKIVCKQSMLRHFNDLRAIGASALAKVGKCHICGNNGFLSKEHMPPKSAFNSFPSLLEKIDYEETLAKGRRMMQRDRPFQSGFYKEVLCQKCNNDTGSWYADAYTQAIKQLAPYASIVNTYAQMQLTLHDVYPLRIAKQAIAMFCGSSGPGLAENNANLRALLLNKFRRDSAYPFDLYLYVRNSMGGRITGAVSALNMETLDTSVTHEFSWWPVGWALTKDFQKNVNACNVTHWLTAYEYDEVVDVALVVPCHYCETIYPLDFRSPREIDRQRLENAGLIAP